METHFVFTENWLTRKASPGAGLVTFLLGLLLFVSGYFALTGVFNTDVWMPASGEAVFQRHEYWRLWTALFVHADAGHLFNNAFLFLPLAYLLSGYFGAFFFPVVGILLGGLINFFVLKSLPASVTLIGISGVVYWMGAAWLTLFVLIDSRKSLRRRLGIGFIASFVLFFPEGYKQEISYMSHFLGYIFGVVSAVVFYFFHRTEIKKAEVKVRIVEDDEELFWVAEENSRQDASWN